VRGRAQPKKQANRHGWLGLRGTGAGEERAVGKLPVVIKRLRGNRLETLKAIGQNFKKLQSESGYNLAQRYLFCNSGYPQLC